MLQGLDLEANFSNLPDYRKKLITYNPKGKMHKPVADAFPKVVVVQALGGARQPPAGPSAGEYRIQNAMGDYPVAGKVSALTRNQAKSPLLFLYRFSTTWCSRLICRA